MENGQIRLLEENSRERILARLKNSCLKYAYVVEDLIRWPRRSRFYFIESEGAFSFLHVSGHPAIRTPLLILDGEPEGVSRLLYHVRPQAPFIVSETLVDFADVIKDYYPDVKLYEAWRMAVGPGNYRKAHLGLARQLREDDLPALERFFGERFQRLRIPLWLIGASAFYGVFEGDELVSLGSSMVSLPEIWTLVSIETHEAHRGKGLATEVTSSLVERAFQETQTVALSVVCDNAAAIRVYEKLGFERIDRCVWADCGANAKP